MDQPYNPTDYIGHPHMPAGEWKELNGLTSATPNEVTPMIPHDLPEHTVKTAYFTADANNSGDISIGPDINASYKLFGAGASWPIETTAPIRSDIGRWYVKSSTASQAYKVLYV